MEVRFTKLTPDNWVECSKLSVAEEQRAFVDDNLFAIAEAGIEKMEPFSISIEDEMVGMIVLDWNPPDGYEEGCVLHHFMLDRRFQKRGYGKASLHALKRLVRERNPRFIVLSYWPGNPAAKLYEAVGFRHTGESWSMIGVENAPSEPVMRLELKEL